MKTYCQPLVLFLFLSTLLPAHAEVSSSWLQKLNSEPGRTQKIKKSQVLFKEAEESPLQGLISVGFKQSDGSFLLGRLIWKNKAHYPLSGFGEVLSELNFQNLNDDERKELFLTLLQESYGLMGTKVYTGPAERRYNRPKQIVSRRGPDDSQRFQIWFYKMPLQTEGGVWREVLYYVSPDGKTVKPKTLGSYRPVGERLRDFPEPSPEFFE